MISAADALLICSEVPRAQFYSTFNIPAYLELLIYSGVFLDEALVIINLELDLLDRNFRIKSLILKNRSIGKGQKETPR